MLVDGELPASEIEAVRRHVAGCAECQSLEKDFLFFRQEIKTSLSDVFEIEQISSHSVPIRKKTPFWSGRISLPAPALALFVVALIGLSAWLVFSRFSRTSIETVVTHNPKKNTAPKIPNPASERSLAHYDAGGRAEIYVVPRQTK